MQISGNNFQCGQSRTEYSYYFSQYVHCWGWASWRRAWKHYDYGMKTWPEFKSANGIELVREDPYEQKYWTEVFDRTFAITGALQLMTTIVAFVGVLSAMMSLQLDKQRQLGILKAIGLTGRQIWRLITLETGLMGTVAGLLSMPTGYVLALILVFIINRRSFGWTLQMQLTPEPFIQAFAIAVSAAVLAGLYPALRIVRRNTSEAIRFD